MHSRTLLLLLLLCCGLNAMAARTTTLTGRITKPTGDSVSVRMSQTLDGKRSVRTLASAALGKDGAFQLRFALDSARALIFHDGRESATVFMLPGEKLHLELHTTFFDETIQFSGQGAARNNALAAMAMAKELTWADFGQMLYSTGGDSTWIADEVSQRTQDLNNTLTDLAERFPELNAHLSTDRSQNERMVAMRTKNAAEGLAFVALKKELIGKPFADLIGETTTGDSTRLAQYKGKTTVLDFWATWCGPCKQEMPYWSELQRKYGDRINFVSISVWDNKEKWQAMVAELGHAHGMFIAREGLSQLEPYFVRSIPRYMVLDKDHNIVDLDAPRPSQSALLKYF